MALENYTRGQKIFMVTLVVLLAAMFTVTGAMITLFGQGGESAPTDHGKLDGEEFRAIQFMRYRRALSIIRGLDESRSQSPDNQSENVYARVPVPSLPRPEFDLGSQPQMVSLLSLWPSYQDQDIWCHIVLARRAKEAGVAAPSPAYMGTLLTNLLNEVLPELDKFQQKDLGKKFQEVYGAELGEFVPVMAEAMQVRDYVESLLADERARLDEVAMIARGNVSEFKAEYMKLDIAPFMEKAHKEVGREHFAWRASKVAGGFGGASPAFGNDRFEEAYDKNSNQHLQAEASFRFEIFKAFPKELEEEGAVEFEEELSQLIYQAVKDETYTLEAWKGEKRPIEARLKEAENSYFSKHESEVKDWTEAQWKEWRDKKRAEMTKYMTFEEVQVDLDRSLREKESLRSAQTVIARFMRHLDERKKERERKLNAELEVIRKDQAVWDGLKGYGDGLRQRFDAIETQMHEQMRSLDTRIRALGDSTGDETARQLDGIVADFARTLSDLDVNQLESLISTAEVVTQRLEQTLNDKTAERDEFESKEAKTNDDGTEMKPEEVAAKLKQFELDAEAIRRKMALRDKKVPLVKAWVEELQQKLSAYELTVRGAVESDVELRRAVLRELLVEIPSRLGREVREARDRIMPDSEIEEYSGQAQLIQANYNSRQGSLRKDAADTSAEQMDVWIDEQRQKLGGKFGLKWLTEAAGRMWTWESLLKDARFAWLENVDGAQRFLEDPQNAAGATSGLMTLPGKGYLILRLLEKTPKYAQGRTDARQRTITLAAMRRARELCVEALEKIREDVIDRGWDAAFASAKQTYGDALSVHATDWFKENEDIPGLYSFNDTDVLKVSGAPSTTAPDQPFVQSLKDIKLKEGVTSIVPHRLNDDLLRRPEHEQWSYLLARLKNRRATVARLEADDFKDDTPYGSSPADLWRNRHLVGSDAVRDLLEPARLLKDHEIIQYKAKEKKDNSEKESSN